MPTTTSAYIAAAIQSILDQTFTDFELVIVDDGSTDGTAREIAKFDDPRLRVIRQPNGGPSAAENRALAACRAQYVALMTGDDVALPHRLQAQLDEYRRGGPRLLFGDCEFIDDAGELLTGDHFAAASFETFPRTCAQLLRRLFERNFINAITCFTETRLFRESGGFDPSLYLLQDHQMWIHFVKKYSIEFLREPLIRYRIRDDGGNLSASTATTHVRNDNEYRLLMRTFFDGVTDELFREAFHSELRRPDLVSPLASACEQALLFLDSKRPEVVNIGVERLQVLFRARETAALLADDFRFPQSAFVQFLATFDPFGRFQGMQSTVFVKTGAEFTDTEVVRVPAAIGPIFRLTVDLTRFPSVQAVRWDPVEDRFSRVCLEKVSWIDGSGTTRELDLAEVHANGTRMALGEFEFDTLHPRIFLPISAQSAR